MSGLTLENGTHEPETIEDKYLTMLWPAILNATTKAGITGLDVGRDYFEFTDKGRNVKIKIVVK